MKNILFLGVSALFLLGSCQDNNANNSAKAQEIGKQAIIVHDEIMPQIAHFDRTTVKIESLLNTPLDQAKKDDLTKLKSNLENATDNMMTWMKDYAIDSTDVAYQEAELAKVKAMKKQFEDVSLESNTKLASFK